jgi:hypothetical protein
VEARNLRQAKPNFRVHDRRFRVVARWLELLCGIRKDR